MRALASLLAAFALLSFSSCLIIPYPTETEVSAAVEGSPGTDSAVVTLGPRAKLADAYEELTERSSRLEAVPALEARDAAFPSGGWTLAELADGRAGERLAPLDLDVLVLLEPDCDVTVSSWGLFFWFVGFFGLETDLLRSDDSAWLLDGHTGRWIGRVTASGEGRTFFAGLFYGLLIVPLQEWSSEGALFDALAERLEALAPDRRVRFAVLALEPRLALPPAPEPP